MHSFQFCLNWHLWQPVYCSATLEIIEKCLSLQKNFYGDALKIPNTVFSELFLAQAKRRIPLLYHLPSFPFHSLWLLDVQSWGSCTRSTFQDIAYITKKRTNFCKQLISICFFLIAILMHLTYSIPNNYESRMAIRFCNLKLVLYSHKTIGQFSRVL